jgi:hypothetical protein
MPTAQKAPGHLPHPGDLWLTEEPDTAVGDTTALEVFKAGRWDRSCIADEVTSYFDRQYGSAEFTGDMDISVSTSTNLSSFTVTRATSGSMPLPTQFPDAQGNSVFIGDCTGMSALSGAHPLWPDTRNPDAFLCPGTATPTTPPAVCTGAEPNGLIANDQQIYTRMTPAS